MEFLFLILIGFLSASLSSMLGVGGGALMVPLILFFTKFDERQAVVICLGSLMIPFLLALIRNQATGSVPFSVYALVTIGGCFGALVGTYLGGVLPLEILRKALSLIMVVVAVKLFFQ